MSRIVSIWLKAWPITRLLRDEEKSAAGPAGSLPAEALDARRPLALVAPGQGGVRLAVLNAAAMRSGLVKGELLSNARSKALDLQIREADPAADAAALERLGLWCQRYTPLVMAWGESSGSDGLFLEVEGSAHLFGGEAGLLADLAHRLRRFGLSPRLAIADTAGAAWAVARYGGADEAIISSGGEERALHHLPLAALRLSEETLALLRRLGFRRIGQVMSQPRAPLAARFGADFLRRLDEALGCISEPLTALVPPPAYQARASFVEPISSQEHVLAAAGHLLGEVVRDLAHDALGARSVRLLLFRVMSKTCLPHDGAVSSLDIGLAAPSRDAAHMARLLALRLDRLPAGLEADFGFEAMGVHVLAAESMPDAQAVLTAGDERADAGSLARLVDTLEQRLGAGSVRWLAPRQSHIPERAVTLRPAADGPAPDWAASSSGNVRPLLLLPRPEAADVIALIPEGPPRQFRWRGVLHQVADAQGPERIGPEWWRRDSGGPERDYYAVEDEAGRRFWLYRAGRYGAGGVTPEWFVHGVFA
jgi:protein ImuB